MSIGAWCGIAGRWRVTGVSHDEMNCLLLAGSNLALSQPLTHLKPRYYDHNDMNILLLRREFPAAYRSRDLRADPGESISGGHPPAASRVNLGFSL